VQKCPNIKKKQSRVVDRLLTGAPLQPVLELERSFLFDTRDFWTSHSDGVAEEQELSRGPLDDDIDEEPLDGSGAVVVTFTDGSCLAFRPGAEVIGSHER
jgi:hypothetical protein